MFSISLLISSFIIDLRCLALLCIAFEIEELNHQKVLKAFTNNIFNEFSVSLSKAIKTNMLGKEIKEELDRTFHHLSFLAE